MTVRKYHMAHCPSCRFYSKALNTCEHGVQAVALKDLTAIKCIHYKKG